MVSTTLVTLLMLLIWQTNLFLAISFQLKFGSVEFIYMSSIVAKLFEGEWLPLAFASFFLSVMYTWNYGSVLKYRSEVSEKISLDLILDLGSNLGTNDSKFQWCMVNIVKKLELLYLMKFNQQYLKVICHHMKKIVLNMSYQYLKKQQHQDALTCLDMEMWRQRRTIFSLRNWS